MTAKELFFVAYRRVCKARSRAVDTEHAAECWRVLDGIPTSLFEAVATRLNATADYFPSPKEWLDAGRHLEAERDQAILLERERIADGYRYERMYHCPVCLDSGLEQGLRCAPGALCGSCRQHGHLYDHTYCRPCTCRDSNPVWQAALTRKQEAAHGRANTTRQRAA